MRCALLVRNALKTCVAKLRHARRLPGSVQKSALFMMPFPFDEIQAIDTQQALGALRAVAMQRASSGLA
jgi:hypothetical protein